MWKAELNRNNGQQLTHNSVKNTKTETLNHVLKDISSTSTYRNNSTNTTKCYHNNFCVMK